MLFLLASMGKIFGDLHIKHLSCLLTIAMLLVHFVCFFSLQDYKNSTSAKVLLTEKSMDSENEPIVVNLNGLGSQEEEELGHKNGSEKNLHDKYTQIFSLSKILEEKLQLLYRNHDKHQFYPELSTPPPEFA